MKIFLIVVFVNIFIIAVYCNNEPKIRQKRGWEDTAKDLGKAFKNKAEEYGPNIAKKGLCATGILCADSSNRNEHNSGSNGAQPPPPQVQPQPPAAAPPIIIMPQPQPPFQPPFQPPQPSNSEETKESSEERKPQPIDEKPVSDKEDNDAQQSGNTKNYCFVITLFAALSKFILF